MIGYFNFKKLNQKYLLTNDLGRYIFATKDELWSLLHDRIDPETDFGQKALENWFCFPGSEYAFSSALIPHMREAKNYLFSATSLHIFVMTNGCNMQCAYCQAQAGTNGNRVFMNKDVAKKAVDIALSSPAKHLTIEFQGGEPLLNYETIRYIVEYASATKQNKTIEFNIVTNLTILTDEIAAFIKDNHIGVSTSLDGNEAIHDNNRPFRNGGGTYSSVCSGLSKLQQLGICPGAIETTTSATLSSPRELIDAYRSQGMDSIFLRPLTPLGSATANWEKIGYSPEEFLRFYQACFDYILQLNETGCHFSEGHAVIFLEKILHGCPVNYMELRSPCGAGVGQLAYNYDGNIYTCDEGRMIAEMGSDAFLLGSVYTHDYNAIMNSNRCKAVCISSVLESLPDCCDCVYSPFCGVCPVVHYATMGDILPKEPNHYRCKIYRGMLDILFTALQDEKIAAILQTWVDKNEYA